MGMFTKIAVENKGCMVGVQVLFPVHRVLIAMVKKWAGELDIA